ncbi:MAG: hypothetical protein KDC38_17790, partial [Planctomycetes bacterium]|nr:hypothetical protein [Planctomycetota bacterium]
MSLVAPRATRPPASRTAFETLRRLGVDPDRPETLPFGPHDATAGSETELQVAVIGSRRSVDLPLSIESSSYFANIERRVAAGDATSSAVERLRRFLDADSSGVWENSWVRFPERALGPFARMLFDNDLRSDKSDPESSLRSDHHEFRVDVGGTSHIRVPVSYLIKLALADSCDDGRTYPSAIRDTAIRILPHFLNDNTSPETVSFHVSQLDPERGNGRSVAGETSRRFLMTHLLVQYANERFELREHGQEATVFLSPQPPSRQRQLNRLISDSFYRELFISPCLSGWNRGEEKRDYMVLC